MKTYIFLLFNLQALNKAAKDLKPALLANENKEICKYLQDLSPFQSFNYSLCHFPLYFPELELFFNAILS